MNKYYEELPAGYVSWQKKPTTLTRFIIFIILTPSLIYLAITEPFKFLMLVAGVIINIPLSVIHEKCHKIGFMIYANYKNATIMPMKGLRNPHCTAKGYFRKSEIALTLLTPLVIMNTAFLLLMWFIKGIAFRIVAGCFMAHLLCCSTDIIDFIWVLSQPRNTLYSVFDTIVAYRLQSVHSTATNREEVKNEQETHIAC